jgi:hypothetical protein
MPLYERLTGEDPTLVKLPVHAFMASLGEYSRGKMTQQQVINAFNLDSGEQAELQTLAGKIINPPEVYPLAGYLALTNIGITYDATGPAKGLGFLLVETAGVTLLRWQVRWNKIGTGTLSWQLWDETNGLEVARVDDAAAAGDNRVQTVDVTPTPSPMVPGQRILRVRCKSTTSTDDPVYYGSCLALSRVERLTSAELHEVLLLGEGRVVPLNSAALVRTRLGV